MGKQKAISIKNKKEYGFHAYGILSDLADYQLALLLNEKMRWGLHSYLPLEDQESDLPYRFDFFGEHNGPGHFQVALWKNWQNDQVFNSELKGMPFFVRITGEWGHLQDKQLLKALKEIVGAPNAIKIKVEKLKQPEFFEFQIMSREQVEERKIRAGIRATNQTESLFE